MRRCPVCREVESVDLCVAACCGCDVLFCDDCFAEHDCPFAEEEVAEASPSFPERIDPEVAPCDSFYRWGEDSPPRRTNQVWGFE